MRRLLVGVIIAGVDKKKDKCPRGEDVPYVFSKPALPGPSKFKKGDRVKYRWGEPGYKYEIISGDIRTPSPSGFQWVKKIFPNNLGGIGEMMIREDDLTFE